MTAADWEFVSTGPNADPAGDSTSQGGIFGGAGRTVRPSFSLGGGVSGSSDIDRAEIKQADQQRSPAGGRVSNGGGSSGAATSNTFEQEENEDTTPAVLPGHARAWFSLPPDGVLDSFLLLQYLRSVLCADGLMKILHCANEQQQRSVGVQSPPVSPPQPLEAGKQRQQQPQKQQQRQLHQLSPPPKIDVSFKAPGHRRRSTGTSPLARAYSHGGLGGASGAASVGGGRGGNASAEGEQTSAVAEAVVAAAMDEAMILAGTNADLRRRSGGSGSTGRRASTGIAVTPERAGNDVDARGGGGSGGSAGGISTSAGGGHPSSSVVETISAKAPECSTGEIAAAVAKGKASELRSAAEEPDRQGHAALGTQEGEGTDKTLQEGVKREGGGVDSGGDTPGATTPEKDLVEDVEIDQADLNFVFSSWQPGVPRSDPAAKRTAAAARKVCAAVY